MDTQILLYIYMALLYLVGFHSVVWCMYTGTANMSLHGYHQNFVFSFAYSHQALLDDVDIYSASLIDTNSIIMPNKNTLEAVTKDAARNNCHDGNLLAITGSDIRLWPSIRTLCRT